jgi:cytochrome c biogenesis protein CcdA
MALFSAQVALFKCSIHTTSIILLIAIIFLAGILDGFNPCAFSTLLLWSSFLLHRFGAGIDGGLTVEKQRKKNMTFLIS